MAERKVIVQGLSLSYSGFFDARELYRMINDWYLSKNYDVTEKRAEEFVRAAGKHMVWNVENVRTISDYVKHIVGITIKIDDGKEVVVDIDGKKRKMMDGNVSVSFIAFVETDYEGKWERTAWRWFTRLIVEKLFFKQDLKEEAQKVEADTKDLYRAIKRYLNMQPTRA